MARLTPAIVLLLASCLRPGGGGSVHLPPASITRGVETPLKLELSSVHEDRPMDRQMTSIKCHYRLAGEPAFTALPMTVRVIGTRHLEATATLPPFPKEAAGPVEYYFDFTFDGHYSQRESPSNPVRVPLQ